MGESDFEIGGHLRARRLRATHPPKPTTSEEHARLTRHERRAGLPMKIEADETYVEVELEKRLRGDIAGD